MKFFLILIPFCLIAACIIGDDFVTENDFQCNDDSDCIATYECKASTCVKVSNDVTPCPDADEDGFGRDEEGRAECELCKSQSKCDVDPDDGNPFIFPGAPDICDSVDNDNDGTTDNLTIECTSVNNCVDGFTDGGFELPVGTRMVCENSACIVKMKNSQCAPGVDPCPCDSNPLPCNNGAYPEVPAACQ